MKTMYAVQPEAIEYRSLGNGLNDIWLRKNIKHIEADLDDETSCEHYEADEEYIRSDYAYEYVAENFDDVYNEARVAAMGDVSLGERIDAIEAAIVDIMEVLYSG